MSDMDVAAQNARQLADRIVSSRSPDCACEPCVLSRAVIALGDERDRLRKVARDAAEILILNGLTATAHAVLESVQP